MFLLLYELFLDLLRPTWLLAPSENRVTKEPLCCLSYCSNTQNMGENYNLRSNYFLIIIYIYVYIKNIYHSYWHP